MAVLRSVVNYELQIANYVSFTILGLSLLRCNQATDKKGYLYNRHLVEGTYLRVSLQLLLSPAWFIMYLQASFLA